MKKFMLFIFIATLLLPSNNLVHAVNTFPDVPTTHWAKGEIEFLSDLGIIKGYPDGTFGPNNHVKRSQAAVMIARAIDLDTSSVPDITFNDVSKKHSAYKEIAILVNEGIFPKTTNFRPNEPLTRGEMARVLAYTYGLSGEYEGEITDVKGELLQYVNALAANNITNIYPDGTYKPNDVVKRVHFAVFFSRILEPRFKSDYGHYLDVFQETLVWGMSKEQIISILGSDYIVEDIEGADGITYPLEILGLRESGSFTLRFSNDQFHEVYIQGFSYGPSQPTLDDLYGQLDDFINIYYLGLGGPDQYYDSTDEEFNMAIAEWESNFENLYVEFYTTKNKDSEGDFQEGYYIRINEK